MPKWWQPKPNLRETIQDIIHLFETKFKKKTFQDGMAQSFVSTFCFPKADGSFVPDSTNTHNEVQYKSNQLGPPMNSYMIKINCL